MWRGGDGHLYVSLWLRHRVIDLSVSGRFSVLRCSLDDYWLVNWLIGTQLTVSQQHHHSSHGPSCTHIPTIFWLSPIKHTFCPWKASLKMNNRDRERDSAGFTTIVLIQLEHCSPSFSPSDNWPAIHHLQVMYRLGTSSPYKYSSKNRTIPFTMKRKNGLIWLPSFIY